MPAPSEITPESLNKSNGRLAFSGSSFRVEQRPDATKLANPCWVMGASAPPAMANSASPERIIAAAVATASNPDGQADETVVAFVHAPILSAIILAAAWGFEAARDVGATPLSPRTLESRNTFSMISRALVLTPITTGIGPSDGRS